jgi:hypothetical protein
MSAISTTPARVLVVAQQTAASPQRLDAIWRRAARGPCSFTLLIPAVAHGLHRVVDPEDQCCEEAERALALHLPPITAAAGAPVASLIGSHEPFAAVQDALNLYGFDEVIVSTLPARLSRWLRLDLPHKIESLGVQVTVVAASPEDALRPVA